MQSERCHDGRKSCQDWRHRLATWTLLTILTGIATWPGIDQSLGHIPEEVRRVAIAAQIASSGDLNPHWFGHPASLLIYILAGCYKLLQSLAVLGLGNNSWIDIRNHYLNSPAGMFMIGRGVSRLATITAAIATYEVAARILPRRWAIAGATLTIINPIFIMHSHRLRSDHILTSAMLLGAAWLGCACIGRRQQKRQHILAAMAGAAITFKYTAACILVAETLALTARMPRNKRLASRIGGLVTTAAVASFISSPFLWIDLGTTLRDLGWEASKKGTWNPVASTIKIMTVMRYSFGDIGTAALCIGLVIFAWRILRNGRKRLLKEVSMACTDTGHAAALITVVYLGSTFMASSWNATWMTPAIPFLTIGLTYLCWQAFKRGTGIAQNKAGLRLTYCCLPIIILLSVAKTGLAADQTIWSARLERPSMSRAEDWIKTSIPEDSKILLWQPHPDQDGFFPRIMVANTSLFRISEGGSLEQICQGDEGDSYKTVKSLPEEMCYPRPRIRSQTQGGRAPSIINMDYLILSSRRPPETPITSFDGRKLQPVASFQKRDLKFPLTYPSPTNFPHGEYAAWMNIRIYKLR